MSEKFNNSTQLTDIILKNTIKEGQICMDATAGNGHDTLRLAKLVGESGLVYSFDIQYEAIKNTRELISLKGYDKRVKFIHDSHENLKDHIEGSLDFVIYNLGYMPGGDKAITTASNTTLKSIESALSKMLPGGIILITVYRGHPGGLKEYKHLVSMAEKLPQSKYNVFKLSFENQKNNPPVTIGIEVRGVR